MAVRYVITKKIAKQGNHLLLIIPKSLHNFLNSGDLVEVSINKISPGDKNE